MFIANKQDFSSSSTIGKKQTTLIYFPEDSGQALTTIHCRRTTVKSVRTTVIRENLPATARKGYSEKRNAYFEETRQAERAIQTASCTRKYDGYFTEDGMWAIRCVVNVETGEVIKCEYITKKMPICASAMRRYGSYRKPGTIFTSAGAAIK